MSNLPLLLLLVFLIFLVFASMASRESFSNIKEKRAVLVVSIGDRSHVVPLRKSQREYAHRIGADYHLVSYPRLEHVPELQDIGWYGQRPNVRGVPKVSDTFRARMLKMIFLRKTLEHYDRVLLLDDTCYVTPETPNLFDIVPQWELGVAPELGELRHCTRFNSGVLLTGKWMMNLLENLEELYNESNQAIRDGDLEWCGADQTILNYATNKYNIRIFYLDPRFNVVSSRITDKVLQEKDYYILHLTGTNLKRTKRLVNYLTKLV
jgi:hypothetical protein